MSSDDIVERLRSLAEEHYEMLGDIHEPLGEAADEIERLIAQDDRPNIAGSIPAKLSSYNDMHEQAVEMGYPSILEALEDLDRLRTIDAARLRSLDEAATVRQGSIIVPNDATRALDTFLRNSVPAILAQADRVAVLEKALLEIMVLPDCDGPTEYSRGQQDMRNTARAKIIARQALGDGA